MKWFMKSISRTCHIDIGGLCHNYSFSLHFACPNWLNIDIRGIFTFLNFVVCLYYFSKTERMAKAVECYRKSLHLNPLLWSSFERLCQLGKFFIWFVFYALHTFVRPSVPLHFEVWGRWSESFLFSSSSIKL